MRPKRFGFPVKRIAEVGGESFVANSLAPRRGARGRDRINRGVCISRGVCASAADARTDRGPVESGRASRAQWSRSLRAARARARPESLEICRDGARPRFHLERKAPSLDRRTERKRSAFPVTAAILRG